MKKKKLIKEIRKIIELDGEKFTDGEIVDQIYELIDKEEKE